MQSIEFEARAFREHKRDVESEATQTAAFFLMTGIDLAAALASSPEEKRRAARRLARLLERERLKGVRRHWSYDLNRHIALKQALERLRGSASVAGADRPGQTRTGQGATRLKPRRHKREPVT